MDKIMESLSKIERHLNEIQKQIIKESSFRPIMKGNRKIPAYMINEVV